MRIRYSLTITAVLATAILSVGLIGAQSAAAQTTDADFCSIGTVGEQIICLTNMVSQLNTRLNTLKSSILITITSPNNDTWMAGKTKNITWTQNGFEDKYLSIVIRTLTNEKPTGAIKYIGNSILATAGSYSWQIPTDLKAGKYVLYIAEKGNFPFMSDSKYWEKLSKAYFNINKAEQPNCEAAYFSNGVAYTSNFRETKDTCITFCDIYGNANLENNIFSKCIFNGVVIKKYLIPNGWCFTFNLDLSVSDKSYKINQVKALQQVLANEGFYKGIIDGIFDVNVLQAVKDFQRKNDINPTGKVASVTRAKLNAFYGCTSIKVTSPNGGEKWESGKTYTITWDAQNVAGNVVVSIRNNAISTGSRVTIVAASVPASAKTATFPVPADFALGDSYDVRVGVGDTTPEDRSDNYFSIVTPAAPSPVTIFRGVNYSGSSQGYNVGSYALSLMRAKGTLNDDISSVKVAPGYQVTFYSADNFRGSTLVKTADDPTLVNDGWNDRISSIVVADVRQPSITVTSPNIGTEQWIQGQTYPVTWNSANVDKDVYVLIKNETTGKITSSVAPVSVKDGSYPFTIDSTNYPVGDKYKAKVSNSEVSDWSDNYFSIVAPITVINGACGTANGVAVSSAPTTGLCATGTASAVAGAGAASFTWTCAGSNGGTTATCSAPVSVSVQPSITVTSPNGGETFPYGNTQVHTVSWTTSNVSSSYGINLVILNSAGGIVANSGIVPSGTSYNWGFTLPSGQYKIKAQVCTIEGPTESGLICGTVLAGDSSDNYFSIVAPSAQPTITVTSPNGGETWKVGETYNITWNSANMNKINIEIIDTTISAGVTLNLAENYSAAAGSYAWTIPSNVGEVPGNRYKISLSGAGIGFFNINDSSDNYFSIVAATVAGCTDSDGGKNYFVRGTVTNQTGSSTDLCYAADKRIAEYYCDSNGYRVYEWYDCVNGCSNGACNQTAAVAPASGFNKEDLIASISAAVARIAQQIQELLSARQQ